MRRELCILVSVVLNCISCSGEKIIIHLSEFALRKFWNSTFWFKAIAKTII